MFDTVSKEQRSINMSHIRGTDTSIETKVRKHLFKKGYRYRKNFKGFPGKPDIYLKRYHTIIFINGCFWHHHANCKLAYIPKTNPDFWMNKFERNIRNDKKHSLELRKMGYHVITIWECRLKKDFDKEMTRVIKLLNSYIDKEVQQ